MAQYLVIGANKTGKTVKVVIEGDSMKTARAKARGQGIVPYEVKPADAAIIQKADGESGTKIKSSIGGIKFQDVTNMTRQLASLIKAHVPVVESLNALVEQIDHPKLKQVLSVIRQHVKEGHSLGDGFERFPNIFNRVYVNMVRAGESSGRLDVVLLRLAEFSENQVRLRNQISGALGYPILMMIVGGGVIVFMFTKIVPQIVNIFVDMKATLPTPTVLLISISDFVQKNGFVTLIGFFAVAVFLERFVKTKAGRAKKDEFMLKVPVLKELVLLLCVGRFSRTLGTLLNSGVPMLNALEITKNVVNHDGFEKAIEECSVNVSEGRPLAWALKQSGRFPPIVIHMVGVGEKTGELESMLLNIAQNYEELAETKLKTLTGLLGPVMIVIMAAVVGFVVIGILQPIFDMNQFT